MKYDIALSFAGDDRTYVDRVANLLRRRGVRYFYDLHEEAKLWGKDLYEHLTNIYQHEARFMIMFVSQHYAAKRWPTHERKAAQARAFREQGEYILPAKFDDTEIPGLLPTTGYVKLTDKSPEQLVELICSKLISVGVGVAPKPVPSSSATTPSSISSLGITVSDENKSPIKGVHLRIIQTNGTHHDVTTNSAGRSEFPLHKRQLLTLFGAQAGRAACLISDWDPQNDMDIVMPRVEGYGSLICGRGHWSIPGLNGTFSPIHDSLNRLYAYTQNIAIDGGKGGQPVAFSIGKELLFEDSGGVRRHVTFVAVVADSFLIEYRES